MVLTRKNITLQRLRFNPAPRLDLSVILLNVLVEVPGKVQVKVELSESDICIWVDISRRLPGPALVRQSVPTITEGYNSGNTARKSLLNLETNQRFNSAKYFYYEQQANKVCRAGREIHKGVALKC